MRVSYALTFLLTLLHPTLNHAAEDLKSKPQPCTVTSAKTGSFFDLNDMAVHPLEDGKKKNKDDREASWRATGYDYGANFTMNFCAPVVENIKDVVGVDEKLWRNVSAFYKKDGKTYSIGQTSMEPIVRGRKLILQYTNGSPCGPSNRKRKIIGSDPDDKKDDDDEKDPDKDDDDKKDSDKKGSPSSRRRYKSTLISLLCDREPLDPKSPKVAISFIGNSPDECAYFFEARSPISCAGRNKNEQAVGPGGVFGIIVLIALAVYLIGGVAYQRTVMHQRGWRQIPNYSLWASVASFCKDILTILLSCCGRLLPRRGGGYTRLPTHHSNSNGSSTSGGFGANGRARRGSTTREDENRLIDQLDEEWDD